MARLLLIFMSASLFLFGEASAATRNRYSYEQEQASSQREMRDTVFELRHLVHNQEETLRNFDNRLKNYEAIIESLRDHIDSHTSASKEMMKGKTASVEAKIGALEAANQNIIQDLKQFKSYADDSSASFNQTRQKIAELERTVAAQNETIGYLQETLKALLDALQIKAPSKPVVEASAPVGNSSTYKVKRGDSLEKIARANGVTISALKELNHLTKDTIREGQSLKIPEKTSESR